MAEAGRLKGPLLANTLVRGVQHGNAPVGAAGLRQVAVRARAVLRGIGRLSPPPAAGALLKV